MSAFQDSFKNILASEPVRMSSPIVDMADSFGWEREDIAAETEANVENRGNFNRGLRSGTRSSLGMLGGSVGIAGDVFNVDMLRDWGFNTYQDQTFEAQKNPLDVQNFTDIESISDTGKWFMGTVGQLAPSMAEMAVSTVAGGGLGGLAARKVAIETIEAAVEAKVKSGLSKELAEKAVKEEITDIVTAQGKKVGGNIGMTLGTGALEGGGMWGEDAEKHGVANANAGSAIGLGLVSGLSETVSPGGMLIKRLTGIKGTVSKTADEVADKFLKRLSKEVPSSMGGEAAQEIFQSFLGNLNKKINDPTVELADREAIYEYINAGAAGAAGGLVFGGVSSVFPESAPEDDHTVDDVLNTHKANTAVDGALNREKIKTATPPDMGADTVGGILGQQEEPAGTWQGEAGSEFDRIEVPGSEADPGLSSIKSDTVRLFTHIQNMALSLQNDPADDSQAKAELPAWVKLKTLKDWENETGEPVKSYVNSTSARETLSAVLAGEPLTEKQQKVWGYLRSVAENQAMQAEQEAAEPAAGDDDVVIPVYDPAVHGLGLGDDSPNAPGNQEEIPVGNEPPASESEELDQGQDDLVEEMKMIISRQESTESLDMVYEEVQNILSKRPDLSGDAGQLQSARDEAAKNILAGEITPQAAVTEPLPEPSTEKHEVIDNPESVAHGQEMNTNPSEKQKEAENYSMAHARVDGFDISIENPAGSTRKGKSPEGKEWESKMENDYGRIKGTRGYDKDHVDVFFAANYKGGGDTVHVINQVNKDGSFDEHKVVMGAGSAAAAMELYNANYEAGWTGGKSVISMPLTEFKEWVTGEGPSRGELAGGEVVAHEIDTNPVVSHETDPVSDNAPDIIEHKTKKGKFIQGIVRTDLTLAEAKAIDPYTFRKDGGFFIREKHLKKSDTDTNVGDKTGYPEQPDVSTENNQDQTPGEKELSPAEEAQESGTQGKEPEAPATKPDKPVSTSGISPERAFQREYFAWVEGGMEGNPPAAPAHLTGQALKDYIDKVHKAAVDMVVDDEKAKKAAEAPAAKPDKPVPAKPEEQPAAPAADPFAKNKMFTSDAVAAAKARMKERSQNLNSGFDPMAMQDVFIIGGAYFESGIRSFTEWAKTVTDDIGQEWEKFLPDVYSMIRKTDGLDKDGMNSAEEVEAILASETTSTKESAPENAQADLQSLDAEIEHLYQLRECLGS